MPYSFKYDWFTPHIPVFERCLGRFRDKPCSALEIGTHEGRSAIWLLENILTHADSRIVCVDLFRQDVLEGNLIATNQRFKVDVRIGYSRDVLNGIGFNAFDFAYVDGSHWSCDVLEDAVMVFRRVMVGGVIGFDDYLWDDPAYNQHGTPKQAIDAFLACYAHKLTVIEHGFQVWVQKIAD